MYHIESVAGFATAGASTAVLRIAQTVTPAAEPWLQLGGTVGLIGGLSYGCITLWKSNQELMKNLRESEAARLKDSKENAAQYRTDALRADESRRELIRETKIQTATIKGK